MTNLTQTIRFATFNCGAGYGDFRFMVNANAEERTKLNALRDEKVTQKELEFSFQDEIMQRIETVVADRLADQLDVICLQETKRLDRPFCQRLQERGFTFYRLESNTETVFPENLVAVRHSSIPDATVENISIQSQSNPDPVRNPEKIGYGQQIAGVILRVNNAFNLVFVSLHSWGFKLFSPQQWETNAISKHEWNEWIRDQGQRELAHKYMHEALALVKSHNPAFAVIAGDLNNNTVNYQDPFRLYEKNGFAVHEPDQPTNVNYSEENYPHRKIDYIFTSQSSSMSRCMNKVKSIFGSTQSFQITPPRVLEGFDFTMDGNCSDHKPFGTTITINRAPAKLSRAFNFLS